MLSAEQNAKFWLFTTLCSLSVWILYWLVPSFWHFHNIILGLPDVYSGKEWYFLPSHFGLFGRFIGVILGLATVILIWGRMKPFLKVKSLVVTSLLFEAAYFLSLFPSFLSLIIRQINILGTSYLLQIIFTVPFIAILAYNIRNYQSNEQQSGLWKWAGAAFVSYVVAMWTNVVFRWLDMVYVESVAFLLGGFSALGFFNAVIFMSLAVSFSVAGAYSFNKGNINSAMKWVGLALAMLGLHYIIYILYAFLANALIFAFLVDIWAVSLLALGVATMKTELKTAKTLTSNVGR